MARIDEIRERIGWLRVLFSITAVIDFALMGWLLTELEEKLPDLRLEDVLQLENFGVLHAIAFFLVVASSLAPFVLARIFVESRWRVFTGLLVVTIDLVLLWWLFAELEEGIVTTILRETVTLWHAGAVFTIGLLSFGLLSAMWEMDKLIRTLGELK